ncbi:MAG TPA: hypothetical protein VGQ90_15595 [Stellaceae bacterium]|nr:hypothetical protein [Stellaceae bacterium]
MEVRVFSTAPKIALLALALAGFPAAAQMVGGQYQVAGTNADGSGYRGTATITPRSNSTCRITWQTGSTSTGICMLAGRAFAASYVLNGKVGLVVYELQADGSLKGVWTMADQPGAGTEILTPAK